MLDYYRLAVSCGSGSGILFGCSAEKVKLTTMMDIIARKA